MVLSLAKDGIKTGKSRELRVGDINTDPAIDLPGSLGSHERQERTTFSISTRFPANFFPAPD